MLRWVRNEVGARIKTEFISVSYVSRVAQEAKMETQMSFEYTRNNHSVGDSIWRFEWCPKYRYNMFRKFEYKSLAEGCIRKAAHEHNIEIKEISVMPDHIHIIAKLPLTMTPSRACQLLKGRSSHIFFRNHPKARLRYPKGHLCSRGKFASSIGYSDIPTTASYIQSQEIKHNVEFLHASSGNSAL